MMTDQMAVIYTAANVKEAYVLKNLLSEQGIHVQVFNESLQGVAGEVPLGWPTAPRLVVPQEQATAARALVLELERQGRTTADAMSPAGAAADNRPWLDWPTCPHCRQRRQAICPACRTIGDDFPLADDVPAAAPLQPTRPGTQAGQLAVSEAVSTPIQLLCPLCGDLLTPQFLRRCAGCDREFADGIDPPT
jgi:hypothetical protein